MQSIDFQAGVLGSFERLELPAHDGKVGATRFVIDDLIFAAIGPSSRWGLVFDDHFDAFLKRLTHTRK